MFVSRTLRDYFRRVYAIETEFIPNGTALAAQTRGPYLTQWNLEADQYVLFLGRFSPEKNCALLIRAFECVTTNSKLVLAGGSSYTDDYVKELRRHAGERVQFLDWVSGPALQELITNAAVFVLPSDLEGLSLALLDAMGAGVCVLASDIPENRELVDDVGFTFASGDQAELTRMLQLLLSDPEMRKRSGAASRRRVQESYLWPQIARQLERVYMDALGVPASRLKRKHKETAPRKEGGRGIYFVAGVQHFQIIGNTLEPAGEDGITVWHSAYGEISRNQGGGNGENTIDVKNSHDVVISQNVTDLDREYKLVVHSVDATDSTYAVRVAGNHCSRGGQGGELSAGIALLFAQESRVENNVVDSAFGSGILIKDAGTHSGNWAAYKPPDRQWSRAKASCHCAPRQLYGSPRRK